MSDFADALYRPGEAGAKRAFFGVFNVYDVCSAPDGF